tara:strand:- start:368 stop:631 length:264 start_codon:yes stop_codon:yes gene_type:complete
MGGLTNRRRIQFWQRQPVIVIGRQIPLGFTESGYTERTTINEAIDNAIDRRSKQNETQSSANIKRSEQESKIAGLDKTTSGAAKSTF